ncbi:MAG: SpoIIE family protein phosphatase [Bacteroidia bacterium]
MNYIIWIILLSTLAVVAVISLSVSLRQKYVEARMKTLETEKSNYESIIEQANDAMFVIDIVDGRVHQCNPSAAQMLGYTKAELERKTLFELQPSEMMEKSSSLVADVWEKKGLIYQDIPFVTKDGDRIPVECSAKVAPFAGRPAIVIYARDITERLRMEQEIQEQKAEIEEKNKDITASIQYSKRIQRSVFTEEEKIKDYAPESFIFFKPRDIVSGDFYWFNSSTNFSEQDNPLLAVAAVDCTGHGVPGAFMSIIGHTLLNQTVDNRDIKSPGDALTFINREIKKTLSQKAYEAAIRDGMDIALCLIDFKNLQLKFAGANNPVYLIRGGEAIELKATKQPITASSDGPVIPFEDVEFKLEKGDGIYLFTDGFADQFGGPKGKKFMYKRFREALVEVQQYSMEEQKTQLNLILEEWRGELEQVDDVLVIGIRV